MLPKNNSVQANTSKSGIRYFSPVQFYSGLEVNISNALKLGFSINKGNILKRCAECILTNANQLALSYI